MILKFRTQPVLKFFAWRLLDEIKQINYGYIDEPKCLEGKKMHPYMTTPDYINTYPDITHKIITQLDIRFRNGDGDIKTIFTDNEVYIMDDSGKTIDTISCKTETLSKIRKARENSKERKEID